jgi:hypothetical protein
VKKKILRAKKKKKKKIPNLYTSASIFIHLTGLCKERVGTGLGGGDKKDTHNCFLTRVGDSLLGWPEMD